MSWTLFYDMHSGGSKKTPFEEIYIESSMDEAKRIFTERFNQDPEWVACECCGENFSISEHDELEQATGYYRRCKYDSKSRRYVEETELPYTSYTPLEEYISKAHVCIIRKDQFIIIQQ